MEKIYIAGCGGMLGEAFYRHFKSDYILKCTDIDVNDEWLGYCDIRDKDAYHKDVSDFGPDYLFHLGALTDLEYCELHPDEAFTTNTKAVENAVLIARRLNIPLLYISTAGIFDGAKAFYDDWDVPNPLCVYAKTKYEGEVYVNEHATRFIVCRPGWMMGGGPKKDKKFIGKIMKQLFEGKKEIYAVNDKMGSPTFARDFARNVDALLKKELWGTYNMMCTGLATKYDVAGELLAILGLTGRVALHAVSSDYFKKDYFAMRPKSEMLINRKLMLNNINMMRDWKVSLREYIDEYYPGYLSNDI